MYKEDIQKFGQENFQEYKDLSDYIWENPETAFEEYKSAQALMDHLEEKGYKVTKGLANIDTAFVGEYGTEGPLIGFLGEFDALSGMSQKAGAFEKEELEENGNGHGCGHNFIGVGSLIAADMVKYLIDEKGLKARIKYFGCPGEEGGSGKAFMARDGAFEGLDLAFCWHPMNNYEVWNKTSMANFQVYYKFRGVSSHAAASPELGRSGLDAVELMNVGVQYLREHVSDETRIHYAITNTGGFSPNVVQPYGEVLYLIRAKDLQSLFDLKERVDKIAQGAALMTETDLEIDFVKGCSNYVSNPVLEEILYESLTSIDLPEISQEDMDLIKKLYETVKDNQDSYVATIKNNVDKEDQDKYLARKDDPIYDFVVPYGPSDKLLFGSTDVGDVSWNCPTGQVLTATWPAKVAAHSWQATAMGKTDHGAKTMVYAGQVIALTAARLVEDPDLLDKVKDEWIKQLGGQAYRCPIPEGIQPRSIS